MKNNKPSVSRTTLLEAGVPIVIGLVTWIGLRFVLYSTLPWPCGFTIDVNSSDCEWWTHEQSWKAFGYPLFSTFGIPFVVFLTISAVFLVRAIRNNLQYFSLVGSLAFSFPLFILPAFLLVNVLSLIGLPIGFILAVIATVQMIIARKFIGNWISLPYNWAWFVVFSDFMRKYLEWYGD